MDQEIMEYDVVIVGGGPSGLAAAIRLKQLSPELSVCILEKGAQIGSHIISGAVLEPSSLQQLLPDDWQKAPFNTPVTEDAFFFLSSKKAWRLPTPCTMQNKNNYIISLGELCRFLAEKAEKLGCEIYPGFAATELVFHENGHLKGVAAGEVGIDKAGKKTIHYQPGMHLYAKQTLFAEGCRGQLSEALIKHYKLRTDTQAQTYGLGIKEIWQIQPQKHRVGQVIHTIGWPLDKATYGGSFLYHLKENKLSIGFVVGLDYKNPWLSPFEEMQKFKTHPFISNILKEGQRLSYGARALNEGGWQSIPKLTFPGGALVGDAAGLLNVAKIKGIHTAIQSGILAAEAYLENSKEKIPEIRQYEKRLRQGKVGAELYEIRNIRPGFRYGLWAGLVNAFLEAYVTKGKSPWTLKHKEDYTALLPAEKCKKIIYPKADGILTFDRLSSVYLSNTYHEENQPVHLVLKEENLAIEFNYKVYASPETRYCPAAVYELVEENEQLRLQINAQNCIHCKACDIKDPKQNICWKAPEGGGGPNYEEM